MKDSWSLAVFELQMDTEGAPKGKKYTNVLPWERVEGSWPCNQMTAWRLGGKVPLLVNTWAKRGRIYSRINWSSLKNQCCFLSKSPMRFLKAFLEQQVQEVDDIIACYSRTGDLNPFIWVAATHSHIRGPCVISQFQAPHYSNTAALLGGTAQHPRALPLLKSRGERLRWVLITKEFEESIGLWVK